MKFLKFQLMMWVGINLIGLHVLMASGGADSVAVISFSGLVNGVNSAKDPELTSQMAIPQSYQPLLNLFTNTNPADGGPIGVEINWEGANFSCPKFNAGVKDYSGDYTIDGAPSNGGVMFSNASFSMIFNKPIDLDGFVWTYYGRVAAGAEPGSISVYAKVTDAIPLKVIKLVYPDDKGYIWREDKSFAGIAITKIVFVPSGGALNIDDLAIRLPKSKP